jgi:hypothetical protein
LFEHNSSGTHIFTQNELVFLKTIQLTLLKTQGVTLNYNQNSGSQCFTFLKIPWGCPLSYLHYPHPPPPQPQPRPSHYKKVHLVRWTNHKTERLLVQIPTTRWFGYFLCTIHLNHSLHENKINHHPVLLYMGCNPGNWMMESVNVWCTINLFYDSIYNSKLRQCLRNKLLQYRPKNLIIWIQ